MTGEHSDTGTASRRWIGAGAVLAAVGVAAGAFGAHALRDALTPERLAVYETAVRYHLLHSVALVVVGMLLRDDSTWLRRGAVLLAAGVALFSGSLYVLVLGEVAWVGAFTPIGGASLIGSWCAVAAWAFSRRRPPRKGG